MKLILMLTLSLFAYASSNMEQLYLQNACNSCHGIYGEGMGSTPRLQGQKEKVLFERVKNLQ